MSLCCWCLYGSKLNTDYAKEYLIEYQNARNMLLTDDEWNFLELYCYMGIFHQILFTIESRDNGGIVDEMVDELLLSIEEIAHDTMFLKKFDNEIFFLSFVRCENDQKSHHCSFNHII